MASLADGKVMANANAWGNRVEGGRKDIFLFDPVHHLWSKTGSLNSGNTPGSGVLLNRGNCAPNCGKVLAIGTIGSAELYSPSASTLPTLPLPTLPAP